MSEVIDHEHEQAVEEITPERILKHYNALGDSVTVINETIVTIDQEGSNEKLQDSLRRNLGHLTLMVSSSFWTTEDFTDVTTAIEAATAALD